LEPSVGMPAHKSRGEASLDEGKCEIVKACLISLRAGL
jgi:hypothetical protein